MKSSTIYSDKDGVLRVVTVEVPKEPTNVCLRCKGKGWITGIEHPCPCNPGGDWRSSKTAYQRHHEALQHCKDTSVPFEDKRVAAALIYTPKKCQTCGHKHNAVASWTPDTFYTVPEFEYQWYHKNPCVEKGDCMKPEPEGKCRQVCKNIYLTARLVSPQQEPNQYCPECKTHDGFKDNVVIEGAVRCYNCGAGREQEPEEQDELWDEVAEVVDTIAPAYRIKRLKEKFTITRKQV